MTTKTMMCFFDISLNKKYSSLLLHELSTIKKIHLKPKLEPEKSLGKEEGENVENIKKLRTALEELFKKLKITNYDFQKLNIDKKERKIFEVKDISELINYLLEEISFYSNRVAELESYIIKVKLELEKIKTIEESYRFLEKTNLNRNSFSNFKILSFKAFTTFSKNLANLENLFDFSNFPNFYETKSISDDRIVFYSIYPKEREEDLKEKVRVIHAEEVPILKKYLTSEGINFTRILNEINFINSNLIKYEKELERLRDEHMPLFAAMYEAVQNIEEYNWAERQFEEGLSNRVDLQFFIPLGKKEEVQNRLIEIFKDQITIHAIKIRKRPFVESTEKKTKSKNLEKNTEELLIDSKTKKKTKSKNLEKNTEELLIDSKTKKKTKSKNLEKSTEEPFIDLKTKKKTKSKKLEKSTEEPFIDLKTKKKSKSKKLEESQEIRSEDLEKEEELRNAAPTIMKNNIFVRPFETLTRMFGTPSYSEIDPTPFLAITFPLLFGLMFGDIGHGIVLIIAGVVGALLFRNKKGSDFLNFCWIIFYCGWGAILCGFLYGEFFGMHDIEIGGQVLVHLNPIKLSSIIPEPNILLIISGIGAVILIIGGIERMISRPKKRRWIIGLGLTLILLPLILIVLTPVLDITLHNPISNILTVFSFAVLIGVIHINLGWFIQLLNYWRQSKKYLAISDSLIKILLLSGGTYLIFTYKFNINSWISLDLLFGIVPFYPILFVVIPGILLIILKPLGKVFGVPYLKKESYTELVGEGSMETFETFLSILSNVASYIRLLALALAHISLMIAIQAMADLIQGQGALVEVIKIIGLIFGNIVVVLIEGLLVFLNALRLNFYEFFFKFYSGTGTEFYPFYLKEIYSVINFKLSSEKDVISEEIEKTIESKKAQENIVEATELISKKFF